MDKIVQIKDLTKELLQYCHEYYVLDYPTISDTEYDKKYDKLKRQYFNWRTLYPLFSEISSIVCLPRTHDLNHMNRLRLLISSRR